MFNSSFSLKIFTWKKKTEWNCLNIGVIPLHWQSYYSSDLYVKQSSDDKGLSKILLFTLNQKRKALLVYSKVNRSFTSKPIGVLWRHHNHSLTCCMYSVTCLVGFKSRRVLTTVTFHHFHILLICEWKIFFLYFESFEQAKFRNDRGI